MRPLFFKHVFIQHVRLFFSRLRVKPNSMTISEAAGFVSVLCAMCRTINISKAWTLDAMGRPASSAWLQGLSVGNHAGMDRSAIGLYGAKEAGNFLSFAWLYRFGIPSRWQQSDINRDGYGSDLS